MVAFEADLAAHPCDLVMVVGDVTSTLACAIVAKKMDTRVAHVEGGIRSFDMSMPEEINRIVTDSLADYFFTTSIVANENLKGVGIHHDRIFFVGNTMIDCLLGHLSNIKKPTVFDELNLVPKSYIVLTLHRPSNVDDRAKFERLVKAIDIGARQPVIFPVHPRTQKNFQSLRKKPEHVKACPPLGYLEFIYLIKNARAVITDSGGIQEETTVLGIPCVTLRNNTERPETVTVGTNVMVGDDMDLLDSAFQTLHEGKWKKGSIPELWDGRASERIVKHLLMLNVE